MKKLPPKYSCFYLKPPVFLKKMHAAFCLIALLAVVVPSGETLTVTDIRHLNFTFAPDDNPVVVSIGAAFDATFIYTPLLQPLREQFTALCSIPCNAAITDTVNITRPGKYVFWDDSSSLTTERWQVTVTMPGNTWITVLDVSSVPAIYVSTPSIPRDDITLPVYGEVLLNFDTGAVTVPCVLLESVNTTVLIIIGHSVY